MLKTETKEYSSTHWQFRYILRVCTLNKLGIAQTLEIPKELVLEWEEDKKKLSDDEIVKKTEVKYIDNINKNFGKLLDVDVRHLTRKLRLAETENVVQKKQINMMKRIVGKTKYKEIYEKAKKEVDSELPSWRKRHKVDMSKLKKRGKADD
ncbi:hypothetical protein PYK01_11475 [Staphylococcus epidermidis]|nr:hypothetical protein [Staphylococcus epidermidis]MDH8981713.1 hypothetical protein [Staphylococcus epidermidis]MDH8988706.1 hypothetical protein [Staphylococcus epidermidis]MDH8993356.1 hypothetical protein [Staphylococcus epidermidis]MDH8995647.1 hypothetical protein [Staphylococcus epidermidis]